MYGSTDPDRHQNVMDRQHCLLIYTTGGAAAAVLLPGGAGPSLLDLLPAHHPRAPGQGQEDVRDPPEVPGHEGISCCGQPAEF